MKHLFVPYEIALLAKEKGFNEDCITRWGETSKKLYETWKPMKNSEDCEDFTAAPLYQQLVDWFDKKHKINISLSKDDNNYFMIYVSKLEKFDTWGGPDMGYVAQFKAYESKNRYESYNIAFNEAFKLR